MERRVEIVRWKCKRVQAKRKRERGKVSGFVSGKILLVKKREQGVAMQGLTFTQACFNYFYRRSHRTTPRSEFTMYSGQLLFLTAEKRQSRFSCVTGNAPLTKRSNEPVRQIGR